MLQIYRNKLYFSQTFLLIINKFVEFWFLQFLYIHIYIHKIWYPFKVFNTDMVNYEYTSYFLLFIIYTIKNTMKWL